MSARVALALLALVWVADAAEAEAQQRVVVREFSGAGGKTLRQSVVKAMLQEDGVQLVPNEDVDAKAASLGVDASSDAGREAVARELELSAYVEGEAERKGARGTLRVRVYDGASGGLAGEAAFVGRGPALGRRVQATFWSELGAAIQATSAPAKTEPAPTPAAEVLPSAPEEDDAPPEEEEEPEPDDPEAPLPSAAEFRIGFGGTTRDFSYNDDLPGLRAYCLGPQCDSFGLGPVLLLDVHWYPAAHVTDAFVSNLGLDLRGLLMIGINSKTSSGEEFTTSYRSLGAGVRLRLPVSDHEFHLVVGYGSHVFEIEGSGASDPGIPGVSYGFLRIGAGARLVVADPVALSFAAAYLLPLAYGAIGDDTWFPHTSGGGLEGELSLAYGLTGWLDLELGGFFTRFFLSHDPDPTDASVTMDGRVAGGSLDQYVGVRAGLVVRL